MHRVILALSVCALGCDLGKLGVDSGDTDSGFDVCEQAALEEDFGSELAFQGGCSDMVLFARNGADTIQLYARVNGVVSAANGAEDTQVHTYHLPDSDITLNVNLGENLSDSTCDDVIEGDVNVAMTYLATGGAATLVIEPGEEDQEEWSQTAIATLTLTGVEFTDGNQCAIGLGDFSFEEVLVGWLPG